MWGVRAWAVHLACTVCMRGLYLGGVCSVGVQWQLGVYVCVYVYLVVVESQRVHTAACCLPAFRPQAEDTLPICYMMSSGGFVANMYEVCLPAEAPCLPFPAVPASPPPLPLVQPL